MEASFWDYVQWIMNITERQVALTESVDFFLDFDCFWQKYVINIHLQKNGIYEKQNSKQLTNSQNTYWNTHNCMNTEWHSYSLDDD